MTINLHKSVLQGRRSAASKREERDKNLRKRHNQSTYVLLENFISLIFLSENSNSEPHNHKNESLVYLPHFPCLDHITLES